MKLEVELVPQSMFFNNVRAAVTKAEWDLIKKKVSTKAKYVCEICGNVGPKHPVECHEIWHYDDTKLIQKLTGMIALCPNCHMCKHIGFAELNGKLDIAIKHMMSINKMKKKTIEDYLVKSFEKWRERSKKQWKLDISVLADYGIKLDKIKEYESNK